MNILDLVVLGIATWRLAYFIVHERAPFGLMHKFRTRIGVTRGTRTDDETGLFGMYCKGTNELAELFCCVHCMSVWVLAALWILLAIAPGAWVVIQLLFVLGIASGADFIFRRVM